MTRNEPRVQISAVLPRELYKEAKKLAIDEGVTASELLRKALRLYLKKKGVDT